MLLCFCLFGLEYCDLPTMLANVANLLRLLALNVDGRKQGTPTASVVLMIIAVAAFVYVYVVSVLWFVFWRESDVVATTVISALGLSGLVSTSKLLNLHLKCNRTKKTLIAYLAFDKRISRDSRMYQHLITNLRIVKRRAIFVWVMLVANGVIYVVKPHLLPGKHLVEDLQVLYGLEPMLESPNFELAHTLVSIAVILAVHAAGSTSALLIIVAGYVEVQMTALSNEILHVWDDAQALIFEDNQDGKKLRSQYIKHQLESIIQAHAGNLSLLRLTERLFNASIGLEFCFLGMALIVDLLGGLENNYMGIPFVLVQVSMNCFTGQRVIEASLRFREAVYSCKWEDFDVPNMKIVLVILQNSQTMVLSAGGITELRYTSLMAVLRSTYSAYAALRSTMHGVKHN